MPNWTSTDHRRDTHDADPVNAPLTKDRSGMARTTLHCGPPARMPIDANQGGHRHHNRRGSG
eukprot:15366552-Alexandrium_andersonii.AAC.1